MGLQLRRFMPSAQPHAAGDTIVDRIGIWVLGFWGLVWGCGRKRALVGGVLCGKGA